MKKTLWLIAILVGVIALAACQPQEVQVEVTRVVTETITEEIQVTRIVEGEVVTEMVEVTRVVEVQAEVPEEEMEPTSLRMAIAGTENSMNPYTYRTGYPGWNMLLLEYDTLLQLNTEGVPQPWLATSAELSEDGLTYTFDLRDDATWHDGEAFTADDVKFTYEYYQTHEHGRWTRNARPIASIETDGDYRVIFTMSAPSPGYELQIAETPIIPQHVWEGVEDPDTHEFPTNIGTGPYKLVETVLDQFYVLEANENYFAGRPQIDRLVFVQFADDAGSLAALRTNAVDMIVSVIGPEQISVLEAVDGISVAQGPEFATDMINYDVERAPFNNKTVRQAMNLAIDRQDLVDTIYLGAATSGSAGWIHPDSPMFNPDVETVYDVEAAISLLEEAGITDSDGDGIRELDGVPMSFEFLAVGTDALRLRTAELVSQMLMDIGIEATVEAVETSTWEEAVWPGFDVNEGRNYDMSMWGWSAPVQANPLRIWQLLHSSPDFGFLNLTGFSNEPADELSEILTTTIDPDVQRETMFELQEITADELPFILLLYPDGTYAYWSSVYDGWTFMTGQGIFHKLSFLPEEARP
jgi:peptide/nickel transport system substrate-binding protein